MRDVAFILLVLAACREINPEYLGPQAAESGTSTTSTSSTTGETGVEGPTCADDPALVACYDFESTSSGELADGSVHGNHGMATLVQSVAGVDGLAVELSSDSLVVVPDADSLDVDDALTLEAWVRPLATDSRGTILDKSTYWLAVRSGGSIRCRVGDRGVSGLVVAAADWAHVACAFDGSSLTLYQNGVEGPVNEFNGVDVGGQGRDLFVGNRRDLDRPFIGSLDAVRIWDRVRTPEEICADAGLNDC